MWDDFHQIVQPEELQVGTHCAKQVADEEVRLLNPSRTVLAIDESFRNSLKPTYKGGPIYARESLYQEIWDLDKAEYHDLLSALFEKG